SVGLLNRGAIRGGDRRLQDPDQVLDRGRHRRLPRTDGFVARWYRSTPRAFAAGATSMQISVIRIDATRRTRRNASPQRTAAFWLFTGNSSSIGVVRAASLVLLRNCFL